MHTTHIFKILNMFVAWVGVACIFIGLQSMSDSGYTPPETPAGWIFGMVWISIGQIIALTWFTYAVSTFCSQKCEQKPRWTTTKMVSFTLILFIGMFVAMVGTYLTWKHPYRFTPCDCTDGEWGPQCRPCRCGEHGVCDSGQFGSGRCACDAGWGGPLCDRCDDRWKPEGTCDTCKTGFAGERCEYCAKGYRGDNCDVCDSGWKPWQDSSDLFPRTNALDDGRRLCDECMPHHWGSNCLPCPYGRDVPHLTLDYNDPIVKGTRVADEYGKAGIVEDMRVKVGDDFVQTFTYDSKDPKVLDHTQIKIRYDKENTLSAWTAFADIQGVECNNRGVCEDDTKHQELHPDWQKTCSAKVFQACTSDDECKVSENCKGTCMGVVLPKHPRWFEAFENPPKLCKTDADCQDPNIPYNGGQCVSRFCCDESHHGSGECDCSSGKLFFGDIEDTFTDEPHYTRSPACEFCPGYDWLTQDQKSICSGGKGTCLKSEDSNGQYLNMRCKCSETVWVDLKTGIADPSRIIKWTKSQCQCGDWTEDQQIKCDTCAPGYWGPDCTPCPGGPGANACSRRGTCNEGIRGDGTCVCHVGQDNAWMLGPYVERYNGDCANCMDAYGNTDTCNECAPNFFGEKCWRCEDTDLIKSSELKDIFQPIGSFSLMQSSLVPQPMCLEGIDQCTLACGGGGWCDWGRKGTGVCQCWSNFRTNPSSWNPLDNVCIGNNRSVETCPSFGYCVDDRSLCGRETFVGTNKPMDAEDPLWSPVNDWSGTSASYNTECTDQCFPWRKIDWTRDSSGMTCEYS